MQDRANERVPPDDSSTHSKPPAPPIEPQSWRNALTGLTTLDGVARLLMGGGVLLGTMAVGWRLEGTSDAADKLLFASLVAFIAGFVALAAMDRLEEFLKKEGRPLLAVTVVASMVAFGRVADPGASGRVGDRILVWAFVVFTVGLAELFILLVVSAVLGRIDLSRAFFDKPADVAASDPKVERRGGRSTKEVSLSRLQSFFWTLVVLIVYFHRVVETLGKDSGLPGIPVELLMVMGISGAVYLTSKGMAQPPVAPAAPVAPADAKPKEGGQPPALEVLEGGKNEEAPADKGDDSSKSGSANAGPAAAAGKS